MLKLEWPYPHAGKDGKPAPPGYVSGELFGPSPSWPMKLSPRTRAGNFQLVPNSPGGDHLPMKSIFTALAALALLLIPGHGSADETPPSTPEEEQNSRWSKAPTKPVNHAPTTGKAGCDCPGSGKNSRRHHAAGS